jgi:uncharacterized protein YndB with AHSA1/START domain
LGSAAGRAGSLAAGRPAGEEMTAPTLRSIVVRRTFAASRQRLFAAWCRPELMAQWFFPAPGWRAEVTADLRAEGAYRVAMHDPAGGIHVQEGVYREIEPDARLVFTWSCAELGVAHSVVTLELIEQGAATELVLTHELPDDPVIRREHEGGWIGCLGSLERFFAT